MSMTDYYSTLGIERHATQDDVRSAYRRMAMKWHPDRHLVAADKVTAEAQFKLVQQAYDTLGNPLLRANYDASLSDPLASMFRGFQQRDSYHDFEQRRAEEMRRYQESMPRGADVKWSVKISLSDALRGTEIQYNRKRRVECTACDGYGWCESSCNACGGSGVLRTGGRGRMCQHCSGHGIEQWDCDECEGKRKVEIAETFKIRVPKGVVDGSEIIARGMGKPSRYGGLPGDLHIKVGLKVAGSFKFAGCNIEGPIKVPFSTAMLGGRVAVDLPTGRSLSVEIPSRTNSGKKIRLAGFGLPSRDGASGDVVLVVSIVLPRSKRKLSAAEEFVLRSLDD